MFDYLFQTYMKCDCFKLFFVLFLGNTMHVQEILYLSMKYHKQNNLVPSASCLRVYEVDANLRFF